MALLIVPSPGHWRSGIQASSTTKLIAITTVPKLSRDVLVMPECSTSHGIEAEVALDHQAHRRAVQGQAEVQLDQTSREVAGLQLLDRVERGELPPGCGQGLRKWRSHAPV